MKINGRVMLRKRLLYAQPKSAARERSARLARAAAGKVLLGLVSVDRVEV